ncbi:MAG: hypothetical protein ACREX5_09040 [Achromobacter pestifer]
MKKQSPLARMLGAALLAAGHVGSVLAQAAPEAPAAAQPPEQARQKYQTMMERAFAKQDVNANGFLDNGPMFQELTAEQLAAMDTDGDGRVSKTEYMEHAMKGDGR